MGGWWAQSEGEVVNKLLACRGKKCCLRTTPQKK